MNVSEKATYIKGLMEGMEIDTSKGEGKLLAVIADLLEDLALSVQDLEDENATLREYIEEIDEDLGAVEEDFYCCDDDDCDCDCCDCDDDDDYCDCDDCDDDCDCCDCCECLELECPACGEPVYIDECDIEDIDELECPSCGKVLTIVETEAEDDDCECDCGCCDAE